MSKRFLLPVLLTFAQCAALGAQRGAEMRDVAKASIGAKASDGARLLDAELFRTKVASGGAMRTVDVALLRDPRNGLTFRTIVSIGDRPFGGVRSIIESTDGIRFIEHDGKLFAISLSPIGVRIREFADRYKSMAVAERAAIQWLRDHPELADPNRIDFGRLIPYWERVGAGFFFDPSRGSQGSESLLRDVTREGDHWLIGIESTTHRTATLVIDDRDQLVDVRMQPKGSQ